MTKKVKKLLRKKFPKFMQKKLVILYVGIILAFAGLVVRITYINAASGEEYTKIVLDQQQYDSRTIPYKRGDIVDRNGTKLATSERVYNVVLDVKAMRTTRDEDSYKHLENSLKIFKALEEKVERFDYDFQKKCVENRDFEALEMYVMNLLMGIDQAGR